MKNHLDDDPRQAAITVQQTNRERASRIFTYVTSLTYVSEGVAAGNCSLLGTATSLIVISLPYIFYSMKNDDVMTHRCTQTGWLKKYFERQKCLKKAFLLIYSKQTPDSLFKRYHPIPFAFCITVLQFFLISLAHFLNNFTNL